VATTVDAIVGAAVCVDPGEATALAIGCGVAVGTTVPCVMAAAVGVSAAGTPVGVGEGAPAAKVALPGVAASRAATSPR
jgi:hypothetical protein